MGGYFNLPNQKQGTYLNTAFINPGSEGNTAWGTPDITMNHIYEWNRVCEGFYFFLHLLGYSPREVHFKIATGKNLVLDLNLMTLSFDSNATHDLALYFDPIASRSGSFAMPNLSYDAALGDVTIRSGVLWLAVAPQYSANRSASAYSGELKFLLDFTVYECLMPRLMARWWLSQPPIRPVDQLPLAGLDLSGTAQTWSAILAADTNPDSPAQELAPDSSAPCGLLWLLNPENWEDDLSPLLQSSAEKIWERFSDEKLDRVFPVFSQPHPMARDILDLKKPFPGLNANSEERFFKGIEEQSEKKQIFLPERLLENIRQFSYLELLMLLINYKIIGVPALPEFKEDTNDEAVRPLEFYIVANEDGEATGVELYLYGMGAPIRLEVERMRHYSPREAFSWQFVAGEGRGDVLIIIAGPGVRISGHENFSPNCDVQIYRVQDHGLVPEWFEPINTFLYEMAYPMEKMPKNAWMNTQLLDEGLRAQFKNAEDIPAFMIKPKRDGMTIMYPSSDIFGPPSAYSFMPEWVKDKLGPAVSRGYSLEVDITVDPTAADQRFSFDIRKIETPEWDDDRDDKNGQDELAKFRAMSLFPQYLLVVHYTGNVRISIREPYPAIRVDDVLYPDNIPEKLSPAWVKYLVYKVDRGADEQWGKIDGDPLEAVRNIGEPLTFNFKHDYAARPYAEKSVKLGLATGVDEQMLADKSADEAIAAALYQDTAWRAFYEVIYYVGYRVGLNAGYQPLSHTVVGTLLSEDGASGSQVPLGVATLVPIESYVSSLPLSVVLMRMTVDVGIGFVPYLGDAVDALELMYAIKTGQDKWGQPVSNFEIQMMMAGAMMPLVSSGALKTAGRVVE